MCGLTGGCGVIGSALVRHPLRQTDHVVINVDKMTYAASEDALQEGLRHKRLRVLPPLFGM
jgi:dTDP-glucose 4,6-dehydratase